MRRVVLGAFLACTAGLLMAREDAPAGAQEFVTKASAGGLAEVNLATLAMKNGGENGKAFAKKMLEDHTKSNKELLALADAMKLMAAPKMDAEHEAVATKLAGLKGEEFDREYLAGQVKDHEVMIALFEKQSKAGDDKLSAWAKKTLPNLEHHLKMAKEMHSKGKDKASKDKDTKDS